MAEKVLIDKVLQQFPSLAENMDISLLLNINNPQHLISKLVSIIPNASNHIISNICVKQQANVPFSNQIINGVKRTKQFDLFNQVKEVNPHIDIKSMSMQQINRQLSELSQSQMQSIPYIEEQSDNRILQEQQIQMQYQRKNYGFKCELKNILQQQDKLMWKYQRGLLDLN